MGAPIGNTNARKAKVWEQALKRSLARYAGSTTDAGLDLVADQLVKAATAGEQWAVLEIGNRLDGKPAQAVTVGGDEDNPLVTVSRIERLVVDANTHNPDR